jgi:hypothetical protein
MGEMGSPLSAMRLPTERENFDMSDSLQVFLMFNSRMFDFHSKDGTSDRHVLVLIYSSLIFYMGVRDLVCRTDLWHKLSSPFLS